MVGEDDRKQKVFISFGIFLAHMYSLSDQYYSNRSEFFAGLCRSYCAWISREQQMEWEPASNSVSLLMRGIDGTPRKLYRYYCNYDTSALREDVEQYVSRVVVTRKQQIRHVKQLSALIAQSDNLNVSDKESILKLAETDTDQALVEFLYRALFVLLREPSKKEK